MRVVDVSHPLGPDSPPYPGSEPPTFRAAGRISEHGFAELRLGLCTHTGTHLDAPSHVLTHGPTLDRLPAGRFVGPGQVLDLRACQGRCIRVEDLAGLGAGPGPGGFVLLWTGMDAAFGRPEYFTAHPPLEPEAAQVLAGLGLSGVGLDAASPDRFDDAGLPIHRILLSGGLVLVENLTNLERLPASGFLFACLPLALEGGDGSPVRAVGLVGGPARPPTE
jgi:kynurenine formamidase